MNKGPKKAIISSLTYERGREGIRIKPKGRPSNFGLPDEVIKKAKTCPASCMSAEEISAKALDKGSQIISGKSHAIHGKSESTLSVNFVFKVILYSKESAYCFVFLYAVGKSKQSVIQAADTLALLLL